MDRLALITGTRRGSGAACAAELLARDWHGGGVGRGPAPAELDHAQYTHQELDLSDLEGLEAFCEGPLVEEHGLDSAMRLGLVNNAGSLGPMGPIQAMGAAATASSMLLNAAAPMWLTGFFLRHARKRPLRVINVSSGAAHTPYPGWGAYCAGKAALLRFDEVIAVEREESPALTDHDLSVVSYAPGVADTAMQAEIRAMDAVDFPRLARFEALHADGELVDPAGPGREMAALLEADDLPVHCERRYAG